MSKAIDRIKTNARKLACDDRTRSSIPSDADIEGHVHDALDLSWMDTADAVAAYRAELAKPMTHTPAYRPLRHTSGPGAWSEYSDDEDDGMISHRQETGAE